MSSLLGKLILFAGFLAVSPVSFAGWSCDCEIEGLIYIIDGDTEAEAAQFCAEEGGKVRECQSRGRGDRKPFFLGESVRVPANPGGVNVCRNFIAYHKKIEEFDITLNGRTPDDMKFMYEGAVVGTMFYNNDGSEAALCTVL